MPSYSLLPAARRAVAVLATLAATAAATDASAPVPPQFTLHSMVTGLDPGTGRDGTTYAMTTHAGEGRVRFDLPRPDGAEVRLLVDRTTGEGWAFDAAGRDGLPVQADAVQQLAVDPAAPCTRMRVTCHREPPKSIAGIQADGWRYAGADRRGPGGSHAGVMWIDPASGIIIGYEARTRNRMVRRMRAVSLRVEPVADAVLEPPPALRGP